MLQSCGVATTLAILATGAHPACAQEPKTKADWVRPQALKPGDTIAFVAPAGPAELPPLRAYAARLEKDGYRVLIPQGIEHRKSGYLAGTDEERSAELNRMIRDPQVRAIFPVRGGYGLTRILDRIDYAALREDPKIITGYSDLTALHLAVARQARLVTFHSPMPMSSLWQGDKPEFAFAAESFRRAVFADQYKSGEIGLHHCGPAGFESGQAGRRDRTGPVGRRESDPHLRDPRDAVRPGASGGDPLRRGCQRGSIPRRSIALPVTIGRDPRRRRRSGGRQLLEPGSRRC